ncbi:MAG TPA: hypothetical protein VF753_10305 [Terriglobales bacterium]
MRVDKEFQRGRTNGNDYVGLVVLIFANVKVTKGLLVRRVRKQYRLHVLAVELDAKAGIVQAGSNSAIDQIGEWVGRAYFIQD